MKRSPLHPLFPLAGFAAAATLLWMAPLNAQSLNNAFGGLSESSNEPIDIRSDLLTVYMDQYALFTGNVKAVQGTTTLRAKELKVHYVSDDSGAADNEGAKQPAAGDEAKPRALSGAANNEGAKQPAAGVDAEPSAPRGGANNLGANQPVTPGAVKPLDTGVSVPRGDQGGGVAAPSTKSADAKTEGDKTAEPTVSDPIDIESDWLLVHDKDKYAHFKGNVRVLRGDTKLRSSELKVNYSGGESLMTTAEGSAGAPAQITKIEAMGDVRAQLAPRQSKGTQTAKKPAVTTSGEAARQPGNAATKASTSSGGKAASREDASATAQPSTTPAGTPKAASTSKVATAAQSNGSAATQSNETAASKNQQITKLEATGEVVITSENDETSTSDWAVYDLPSELVTIGGNVVLTQKETVLKGDRLVIDLKTGESRFENTGTAATGGRRIRALFMPKDGAKPSAKSKEPADDRGTSPARSQQTPEAPAVDDTEPLELMPEFQ